MTMTYILYHDSTVIQNYHTTRLLHYYVIMLPLLLAAV